MLPHDKTWYRSFVCSIRSRFYSLLPLSNWYQSLGQHNQISGKNGSGRRHKVLSDTAMDLWSSQMYPAFYLHCSNATSRTDDEMNKRQQYHEKSICESINLTLRRLRCHCRWHSLPVQGSIIMSVSWNGLKEGCKYLVRRQSTLLYISCQYSTFICLIMVILMQEGIFWQIKGCHSQHGGSWRENEYSLSTTLT